MKHSRYKVTSLIPRDKQEVNLQPANECKIKELAVDKVLRKYGVSLDEEDIARNYDTVNFYPLNHPAQNELEKLK